MIDFGFGVELGRLREENLPYLMEWRNDYAIRKWTRQFDVLHPGDHAAWFEKQRLDPTIEMYGVCTPEDGLLVGVTGLTSIDRVNRRAEFSLYIGKEHWGQGLGQKTLATLLSHAFRNHGLNLVWGETFDGNPAAKTFEALGFQKEGTRRQFYFRDGKFIDAHLYSITGAEWESLSPSVRLSLSRSS